MAKYPSQYTGQNFDTSVQRALNQFPGQISTLNTKVAALEEDVDDLSGLPAQVTQIGSKLGDLANLQTSAKTSAVAAINEVNEKVSNIASGKYYGYYGSASELPASGTQDGYAYVGATAPYSIYNGVSNDGAITWTDSGSKISSASVADEEDITQDSNGKLSLKDRGTTDGMGYIILRKNKTFASQVTKANTIYEIRYDFDLNGIDLVLPNNSELFFNGGLLYNGTIRASKGCSIRNFQNIKFENSLASLLSSTDTEGEVHIFNGFDYFSYLSLSSANDYYHYCGQRLYVEGYEKWNDGGASKYAVYSESQASKENSDFHDYWVDQYAPCDTGLFKKIENNGIYRGLWFKLIPTGDCVDFVSFGVKYDANKLLDDGNGGKKWYTDENKSSLSTDNHDAIINAIGQVIWWSNGELPKTIMLSGNVVVNSPIQLIVSLTNISIIGSRRGLAMCTISTNESIDYIFSNLPNDVASLTSPGFYIENIYFHGNDLATNGVIIKNQASWCSLDRCRVSNCQDSGVVLFGVSSTFHLDNLATSRNKHGIKITSSISIGGETYSSAANGLFSLNNIIGDWNTESLICIDCEKAQATSIMINNLHAENQNRLVYIKRNNNASGNNAMNVYVNGGFCDTGDWDVVDIDANVGLMPFINVSNIRSGSYTRDRLLNDRKNSRVILMKDSVGYNRDSGSSIIYGIAFGSNRVLENPIKYYGSNGNIIPNYPIIYNRAVYSSYASVGFCCFDTNAKRPAWYNGETWVDGTGNPIPEPTASTFEKVVCRNSSNKNVIVSYSDFVAKMIAGIGTNTWSVDDFSLKLVYSKKVKLTANVGYEVIAHSYGIYSIEDDGAYGVVGIIINNWARAMQGENGMVLEPIPHVTITKRDSSVIGFVITSDVDVTVCITKI